MQHLRIPPASVANTRLTEKLNPLDATLTKTQGGGYSCQFWKGLRGSAMKTRLLIQVLSFHTLAHSFAFIKNSSLFFHVLPHSLPKTTRVLSPESGCS